MNLYTVLSLHHDYDLLHNTIHADLITKDVLFDWYCKQRILLDIRQLLIILLTLSNLF